MDLTTLEAELARLRTECESLQSRGASSSAPALKAFELRGAAGAGAAPLPTQVLSALADAGILSSLESQGVFSKLEAAGAFSTAEKLLPLSTLPALQLRAHAQRSQRAHPLARTRCS